MLPICILLLFLPAFATDTDGDGLEDADEVIAHLPPLVADTDGDGLFDHIDPDMDGDGIANVDECRAGGVSGLALVNGGFELPYYGGTGYKLVNESAVPGWDTSAPDNLIELWYGGFIMPPYEGHQIVELNANYASTLYQDVPTTYGDVYIYAFSHRGRAGTDTMRFLIGGVEIRTVSDGPGAWGRYGGVFTIEDAVSSFQFQAVSSSCGASCGNLLDAISFTPACNLDTDADGTPDALDDDEDNDGVQDASDVCPGEDDALDLDGDALCSLDPCPLDPWNDWDGDGVCGDLDLCAGFDDAQDMDADGLPDGCDTDRDGDGWHEWDDCNENDPSVGSAELWYADADGDGFGDFATETATCFPPLGWVNDKHDCLDTDALTHPGASETCLDTLDLDCDGSISFDDPDGDSVCSPSDPCPSDNPDDTDGDGLCESADACPADPENDADGDLACADVDACPYDALNDADLDGVCGDVDACPGADDAADLDFDGTPDGCDSDVDGDGAVADCDDRDAARGGPDTYYADMDGDGYGSAPVLLCAPVLAHVTVNGDCDDFNSAVFPGAVETCLDAYDRDCDGVSSYADLDGDGTCDATDQDVDGDGYAAWVDCDDRDPLRSNGVVFYVDADRDGYGGARGFACTVPAEGVLVDGDCADADPFRFPGAPEDCLDRSDTNCDGVLSFSDYDEDGVCVDACAGSDDADDTDGDAVPDGCDADKDGDGVEDDLDCADLDASVGEASIFYLDFDGDGYGDALTPAYGCAPPSGHVSNKDDCQDASDLAFPGATESCDRMDNDCDGTTDENCGDTGQPPDTSVDEGRYEGGWGCNTSTVDVSSLLVIASICLLRRRWFLPLVVLSVCAAAPPEPAEMYRASVGPWMLANTPETGFRQSLGWSYGTYNFREDGEVTVNQFTHADAAGGMRFGHLWLGLDATPTDQRVSVGGFYKSLYARCGMTSDFEVDGDLALLAPWGYLAAGTEGLTPRLKLGGMLGPVVLEQSLYADLRNETVLSLRFPVGSIILQPAAAAGLGHTVGTPRTRVTIVVTYLSRKPSGTVSKVEETARASAPPEDSPVEVPPPTTEPSPSPVEAPPSAPAPVVALPASLTGGADALVGFMSANPHVVLVRIDVHAPSQDVAEDVKRYMVEHGIVGDRLEFLFTETTDDPYVDAEIIRIE
jgi:hypothetical protein